MDLDTEVSARFKVLRRARVDGDLPTPRMATPSSPNALQVPVQVLGHHANGV